MNLNDALDTDALHVLESPWTPWVDWGIPSHVSEIDREKSMVEALDRLESDFRRQLDHVLAAAFDVGLVVGKIARNAARAPGDSWTVGMMIALDRLDMQLSSENTIANYVIHKLRQISNQVSDLGLDGFESRRPNWTKIDRTSILREIASLVSHVVDPGSFR